jgi:hypothetical protein
MTLEADSGVSWRPIHSTKSLSGSIINSQHPETEHLDYSVLCALTHQVEVDTVIHEVVLPRLHILRGTEVHTVLLAHVLDLFVRASQTDNAGVELLQVLAQDLGGIADRIASNENRHKELLVLSSGLDLLDDLGHLVQLVRADIRAVSEAEVNLQ